MINKNEFYRDERSSPEAKSRIWNRVQSEISQHKGTHKFFHPTSFAFGAVSIIVLYFFSIGVLSAFQSVNSSNIPAGIEINQAYRSAITEFEKVAITKPADGAVEVDDYMKPRLEKINSLNRAISEFRTTSKIEVFEPVKEERLRALYALKLQTLQELIDLEGKSK